MLRKWKKIQISKDFTWNSEDFKEKKKISKTLTENKDYEKSESKYKLSNDFTVNKVEQRFYS